MARQFFNVEKGLGIFAENGLDALVRLLSGTAAPDGLGDQSAAPIGSLYIRSGTGELYQKILNNGNAGDWQLNGTSTATIGNWRPERVVLLTDEVQGAGVRDVITNPFSDDEGTIIPIGEYVVGKYIISDADGTPVLLEITNVAGNNVTFAVAADPMVADDAWVVNNYLPDSPDSQELEAIVVFNGTTMTKVADVNWNIADGINMAAGYTPANGTITSADTVNSAIEKLDGNQQDIQTTLGVTQGSTSLGASSVLGNVVSENATIKQAVDQLDEAASNYPKEDAGVSAPTVLDAVLVDDFRSCVWLVTGFDEANPNRAKSQIIHGTNNGTSSADATSADDNKFSLNSTGNFNFQADVVLNGVGASQEMRLQVNTTEPGVTFTCVRLGAAPSGY